MLATACVSPDRSAPTTSPSDPPPAERIDVLMVTATAGFRHGSIDTARQVLAGMAADSAELAVTMTEDLGEITPERLASTDVLFFALTTGELAFSEPQKSAIVDFVSGGGGFVGAHSAADTLYGWPAYGELVGAWFEAHPWTQEATVVVENAAHPATRDLGNSFRLLEEYYTFRENPRGRVDVLLSLDADSVGAEGDFPLAWSQTFGQGRSLYTALGHFDETWTDPRFQAHLLGAIRWAAGRE
jgi:type 1 glutamine amidotransferase